MTRKLNRKRRRACLLRSLGPGSGRRKTGNAGKPAVRQTGLGWVSGNWSGYAIEGNPGSFRRISGAWTVPAVRPGSGSAYSSAWIGIDGFRNDSLIQTGTGHEYVGGKAHYYAWWEILPDAETVIPLPVYPGDRIRAVIAKRSRTKWAIRLSNLTRCWTFYTLQSYEGPQSSAEWIVEAPQVGGTVARMARLTPVRFVQCRVNGCNPGLKASQSGVMLQNGRFVSIPSRPSRAGDAFVVTNEAQP
ncbi:Peptidase A4 family protein [Paenibacillus sp. UNCCL117]|uniref:G1 family glutamic endopeptidase n=1 Tax=unclassified Paenibacillus TaxID=185978 RepID=UPI000886A32F|nr:MULTISPECIES: G1 family glutamic endopeptidase [unclassified Paenibacillus]SDD37971.1 Peptidase A4 family protein [Paenibacillus sp. cl123]SFW48681.1 Peptidase A4 family protein [Paenibacillus sp. UNCCL117]